MNSSSEGSAEAVDFCSGFEESDGAADECGRLASGLPGPDAEGVGWEDAFGSAVADAVGAVEEAENWSRTSSQAHLKSARVLDGVADL
jgi:hypothetical protein